MFISAVVHQGPYVRGESSTSLTKIKPPSILRIMFIFNKIANNVTIVHLFLLLISEKCIYSFTIKNILLLKKKQVNTIVKQKLTQLHYFLQAGHWQPTGIGRHLFVNLICR